MTYELHSKQPNLQVVQKEYIFQELFYSHKNNIVNPFIPTFDINTKIVYNDDLNGNNYYLQRRLIIRDIQNYGIFYSKKHMLWAFVRITSPTK